MTSQPTTDETTLPADLMREAEKTAAEEGRDVGAVVAAGVRRYLWDATFRKLRKAARERAFAQAVASDEAVLTSVLALRRPDEFSMQKPTNRAAALVEDEDEAATVETRTDVPQRPSGPRERERERERERSRRRRRGKGDARTPAAEAPAAAVPTAAVESLRRRVESVHRFLPPEEPGAAAREEEPREESAPPARAPMPAPPPERPVSRAASPASPPESPAAPAPSESRPSPPASETAAPSAPGMMYGRRPKRGARRGP